MGELYNPYPKLPRNIRQIGEKDDVARLYMEDYVSTYLKRLVPTGENVLRVGLLLGNLEERDGVPYLFVDGAMELEDLTAEVGNVEFTEAIWKKAYQDIEQSFPKRTVQGWFLCGARGSQLKSVDYWKAHGQYFAGKFKVMYLNSGEECEEELYITLEEGMNRMKGYCIYYERNQMMQDYMVLRNDSRRTEIGVHDRVTRDFRDKMAERKGQFQSQRNTMKVLTGVCGALSIAVLAGGIVMFRNYSQMKQMESVIASVMPQTGVLANHAGNVGNTESANDANRINSTNNASDTDTIINHAGSLKEGEEKENEKGGLADAKEQETRDVEIAVASGGVYPTQAAGEEHGQVGDTGDNGVVASNGVQNGNVPDSSVPGNGIQGETMPQAGDGTEKSTESAGQSSGTPGGNKTAAQADSGIVETTDAVSGKTVRYYVVGEGETLYGICLKVYHSLSAIHEICEVNGLESQDKIIAGQKLQLP
ncbi:MAG: LysM domain-containing protein [bacterium]|nr:LysM domain-containing protein [bacterium]